MYASKSLTTKHVRGRVYICTDSHKMCFKIHGPRCDHTELVDIEVLKRLIVVASQGNTSLEFPFGKNDINQLTLIKLWSIGTIKDVRKSSILLRSAKNALERSVVRARDDKRVRILNTQGLKKQIAHWKRDPHSFGHPSLRHRSIQFSVFPDGRIQMLAAFGNLLDGWNTIPKDRIIEESLHLESLMSSFAKRHNHPISAKELNTLRIRAIQKRGKACFRCGKSAKKRCECCGERFCSKACQRAHHVHKKQNK